MLIDMEMAFDKYLTGPERDEGSEGEASLNLGTLHLCKSGAERNREGTGRAGLDLDLGHFEGAESDISEDFSGSGTDKPDSGLVFLRKLFAGEVHVVILEELIETVLEHSLKRVADESGTEAFPDTLRTFLGNKGLETGDETGVFRWVYLWQEELRLAG